MKILILGPYEVQLLKEHNLWGDCIPTLRKNVYKVSKRVNKFLESTVWL